MGARPTILVFDSGLGGLTVYREIAAARPDADFLYLADDAAFPYGALAEPILVERLVGLLGQSIAKCEPDLIVIACNTASTIALPALRKKFAVPFVGTVPAIKPACATSRTQRVAVLGTEATVKREYTRALIRDHAQGCTVDLVGSKKLAAYAEAELHSRPVGDARLAHRNCPLLSRRGQANRHGGARLHALSIADRAFPTACALAGELHRSRTGYRAPRDAAS